MFKIIAIQHEYLIVRPLGFIFNTLSDTVACHTISGTMFRGIYHWYITILHLFFIFYKNI